MKNVVVNSAFDIILSRMFVNNILNKCILEFKKEFPRYNYTEQLKSAEIKVIFEAMFLTDIRNRVDVQLVIMSSLEKMKIQSTRDIQNMILYIETKYYEYLLSCHLRSIGIDLKLKDFIESIWDEISCVYVLAIIGKSIRIRHVRHG